MATEPTLYPRGFHRILKASRAVAGKAAVDIIGVAQLAEALQYRPSA